MPQNHMQLSMKIIRIVLKWCQNGKITMTMRQLKEWGMHLKLETFRVYFSLWAKWVPVAPTAIKITCQPSGTNISGRTSGK